VIRYFTRFGQFRDALRSNALVSSEDAQSAGSKVLVRGICDLISDEIQIDQALHAK